MHSIRLRRFAPTMLMALAALATLGTTSCQGPTEPGGIETGTLKLSVVAKNKSGDTTYRLVGAVFLLDTGVKIMGDDFPGDTIDVSMPVGGNHWVTLQDGWSLQKLDGRNLVPVVAQLMTSATVEFRITSSFPTSVEFRFMVGEDVVSFGNGLLEISIAVEDLDGPCSALGCARQASCDLKAQTPTCTCNAGYIGDGYNCELDPSYVGDVSEWPVLVTIDGVGAFRVQGLSRIGYDLEAIEVPVEWGKVKFPGVVSYPPVVMRQLSGDSTALQALAAWAGAAAPAARSATFALQGIANELLNARLLDCYPRLVAGSDPTVIAELVLAPKGLAIEDYTPFSEYYDGECAAPGYEVQIDGVTSEKVCYQMDELEIPRAGSTAPVEFPHILRPEGLILWGLQTVSFAYLEPPMFEYRSGSLIRLAESGEVGRINMFETWPSSLTLFNPTRRYRASALVDVKLQMAWNEHA